MQSMADVPKYIIPQEKPVRTPKSTTATGPASSDRPYACPYEGCEKAYIHEYKLNLHLRREHPGHFPDENAKNNQQNNDNEMDEGSDHDPYVGKRNNGKVHKQSRPKPSLKMPPAKVSHRKNSVTPTVNNVNLNLVKKHRPPLKEEMYEEEDSEETEEERENIVADGWRYADNNNEDDDEETEYED